MAAIAVPIASAVITGLLSNKGSGGSSQVTKDPWAAAQPWLKGLLTQGQGMQDYYQKNPFSTQQKGAYENSNAANNQYNKSFGPGMMNWATTMMNNGISLPDLPALPGLMSVGNGAVNYSGTYQPKVSMKSATAPTWDASGYTPTTIDWTQQPFSSDALKTINEVMAKNEDPATAELPQEVKDWMEWMKQYISQYTDTSGGGGGGE